MCQKQMKNWRDNEAGEYFETETQRVLDELVA